MQLTCGIDIFTDSVLLLTNMTLSASICISLGISLEVTAVPSGSGSLVPWYWCRNLRNANPEIVVLDCTTSPDRDLDVMVITDRKLKDHKLLKQT